jgi:hypothetical protein
MNMALAGFAMLPLAKGQMPAKARNRVDLPLPDGPLSRMWSPVSGIQRHVRQQHGTGRQGQLEAGGFSDVDRW